MNYANGNGKRTNAKLKLDLFRLACGHKNTGYTRSMDFSFENCQHCTHSSDGKMVWLSSKLSEVINEVISANLKFHIVIASEWSHIWCCGRKNRRTLKNFSPSDLASEQPNGFVIGFTLCVCVF